MIGSVSREEERSYRRGEEKEKEKEIEEKEKEKEKEPDAGIHSFRRGN